MERPFDTRHILSPSKGPLSKIVQAAVLVPTERVMDLLNLGSIYVDGVRAEGDRDISAGTYVRVHLKPKRYPVEGIKWADRIVFQNDDFLIVNKPKNIPVHPMLDNKIENVAVQLARHLGYPLFVTQRLDVGTEGLFLLAKTKDFQRRFNGLLKDKKVFKRYVARAEGRVREGHHSHFMFVSPRSPKIMADKPGPVGEWIDCHLKVIECLPRDGFFETSIELITGRTHQIRAQLAHMGVPLRGDRLYGSQAPGGEFFLVCDRLSFEDPETRSKHDFSLS